MTNMLLKSVKRIIKKGLHKDYKSKLINEQFIKGKIDFKKVFKTIFKSQISCTADFQSYQ